MAPVNGHRRVLMDRYELGEVLGRGGMAEVRAGWDHRLGREVAVKILRSDKALDMLAQTRFRREALSAASLNHPAIVAVYDSGEEFVDEHTGSLSPTLYIVMELVHGTSLFDLLRTEPPDVETALRFASGVLSALEYSHHKGIVHRDIKPANVMITRAGDVKVMDFGIARAMADATSSITQTLSVIGTAEYLSPEQARGEQVDPRSDLYSLGCLLYELLTGRPPFVGDSPVSVAYQHVRERAQAAGRLNPAVPKDVDRILTRALAKGRGSRYQTAEEFRRDIETARAKLAPSLPPPPPPDDPGLPQHRAARRRHSPTHVAAGIAALVIGALAVWVVPKTVGGGGPSASEQPPPTTASVTATSTSAAPSVSTSVPVLPPPASPTPSATRTTRATATSTSRTPSPSPTTRAVVPPSPSRSTPPVSAAWNGPCTGSAVLSNSWTGAYQAVITVRNGASAPVPDGWAATVPLPAGQTLANGWDATVSGIDSGTVTAKPYTAGPLTPGGTLRFVVQVNAATPVLPASFSINGVSCS